MPRRHDLGFTLLELLVVIGIFVVLTAIIVPIGQRLRETNRTSTCEAHLAHIGQALRAYYMDEGGVPPVGVPGSITGGKPSPSATTVDLAAWPSLQCLYVLGYLGDRNTLHCPRHTVASTGKTLDVDNPEFYQSYLRADPKAKPSGSPLLRYKYMPYRYQWAGQSNYPNDARRQLATNIREVNIGGTNTLVSSCAYGTMPADDTIVTWCNYHADTYKLNGHGQYVVLYWDDSVKLLDQELFRDTGTSPDEAWLVKPSDTAH
jgi:prepilin-type N-terminal cleavage/methylation domain-containing protein